MQIDEQEAIKELARLRNRHVAKLLSFIGPVSQMMERAIKAELSQFEEDCAVNILGQEPHEERERLNESFRI